jgi:HEAT repeat protein
MKKLLLTGALLAVGGLALQDVSIGHGGTYRGPGDTVPPGGGGGGGGGAPSSPGPSGPSAPGPSGPSSPGPSSPGSPGGAPSGGGSAPKSRGGGDSGPDLSQWDFWWGFNKEPYLNLKSKIRSGGAVTGSDDFFLGKGEQAQAKDTLRPSEATIRGTVVPALLQALEKETANDILTGAMIALAKIGDVATEDGNSQFVDVISKFLASGSLEVSETAAVALGILGDERSLPLLVSLMKDESEGRKSVGGKEVPNRTRAFAAYGLGLIGYRTQSNTVRQDIAEHLIDVLNAPDFASADIKVGAMSAIGLIPLDWTPTEGEIEKDSNRQHVVSRAKLARFIADYMDPEKERANNTTRTWFVRTHGPIALGRLLQGEVIPVDALEDYKYSIDTLLSMAGEHSKERKETQQSAVIAMGMLANSSMRADKDDLQGKYNEDMRARILEVATQSSDNQSEYYAMIALAQSGGRPGPGEKGTAAEVQVQKDLLTLAAKAKGQKLPWASLALGVYGRQLIDNGRTFENSLRNALRETFGSDKTPQTVGAHALALGLIQDQESRGLLIKRFNEEFKGSDETRGHIAVGLGLLEAREAIEPIQAVVKDSKYKPDLLKQTAVALGLLGDKKVVPDLIDMLKTAKGLSSQAAIASALGTIGDSRSVDPLVEFLHDKQYSETARGFAAVALGIVCDKEDLPWNTKLSVNCNYRANTLTLTGNGTGILDIL